MKIILTAFNQKLWGKPMDMPDNTTPDFYLPMPMDVLAFNPKKDMLETTSSIAKKGHWRRTGGSFLLKDFGVTPAEGESQFCYEYKLIDIF